jgi:hypothetical protein
LDFVPQAIFGRFPRRKSRITTFFALVSLASRFQKQGPNADSNARSLAIYSLKLCVFSVRADRLISSLKMSGIFVATMEDALGAR